MEILANESEWTGVDDERWNAFLKTDTGKRLIPKLIESAPALLATGDVNAILIRTGEFRGFQQACQRLIELSFSTQAAPALVSQNEYPPLEDDAAWNDGKKLEPEPKDKQTPETL